MTDDEKFTQPDTDDPTWPKLVIEDYTEYDDDKLLTEQAYESIKTFNQGKEITSQNSSCTKFFISELTDKTILKKNSHYQITQLRLFHTIQWTIAKRRAKQEYPSEVLTIENLSAECGNRVSKQTIRNLLDDLYEGNLIAIEKFGNTKGIRLAEKELGPVFEKFSEDDSDITIEAFSSEETSMQFLVGLANNIKATALRLFRNETRAGMVLFGMFLVQTIVYIMMLRSGYLFVEGTIRQYSLTTVGLVGGLALIVGIGRQSINSLRTSSLY